MKFWDWIKSNFVRGSVLTRLIYINLGLFIIVRLLMGIIVLTGGNADVILNWLAMPADFLSLITRPWTAITYMFLHYSFLHILFNLIALYWFGRLFTRFLTGNNLLSVYVLGGLSGAAMYFAAYNLLPFLMVDKANAMVLGASASIYAVLVAVAFIVPNYEIYVPFISQVKIKWLAIAFIVLDLISLPAGQNMGGHIAHLGGAIFGYIYAVQHKQGNDITRWFEKLVLSFVSLFKQKSKMHVSYKRASGKKRPETDMEYNARKRAEQDEINRILDKVSTSGYGSLTKREKEILFKSSNKQ
ncbi:MAG: rhomboid family intramembrane serine protease [Bacteroidales bacterium]